MGKAKVAMMFNLNFFCLNKSQIISIKEVIKILRITYITETVDKSYCFKISTPISVFYY